MGSKIGLILSMIFVALFFAFGVDLVCIQYAYSELDASSVSVSYLIAQHGSLDNEFINSLENKYNFKFECIGNCAPLFGDVVDYKLSKEVTTFVISNHPMTVSILRSAVIGYFG